MVEIHISSVSRTVIAYMEWNFNSSMWVVPRLFRSSQLYIIVWLGFFFGRIDRNGQQKLRRHYPILEA